MASFHAARSFPYLKTPPINGLNVKKNFFSVTLTFNKKKEILQIPFKSIIKFYDPFVKFSIQLELKDAQSKSVKNKQKKERKSPTKSKKIITLDDFRKKK